MEEESTMVFRSRSVVAAVASPASGEAGFGDVDAAWQQGPVSWMSQTGITTGTSPTTYSPGSLVTRGQLATFFWRFKGAPTVAIQESSSPCGVVVVDPGGPADDDFDGGPVNLLAGDASPWRVYNGAAADVIDIDLSADGALVMVPSALFHNGWYATGEGPFAYQEVTGDFAAAIRMRVVSVDDPTGDSAPGPGYNSGGFVLRDGG